MTDLAEDKSRHIDLIAAMLVQAQVGNQAASTDDVMSLWRITRKRVADMLATSPSSAAAYLPATDEGNAAPDYLSRNRNVFTS